MVMLLNSQNYHSNEADKHFMSNSQYKDFRKCEAMAMAKIFEGWTEPTPEAFLVGSYVHAWNEGVLDDYKAEHPEIYKANGQMYSEYIAADRMIHTLNSDPLIRFVLQGQKEVILSAEFSGAYWKIKIDTYYPEKRRIVDVKTVKAIREKYWSNELGYTSFVEAYGYITQMSIYAEIERIFNGREDRFEPLIVAVSKEDVPDKAIISIDDARIQVELEEVKQHMDRIVQVKAGKEPPNRCERCRYCRETKQLRTIMHYSELVV